MSHYNTIGIYMTEDIRNKLNNYFYNKSGVIDIETYFDPQIGNVPEEDPGAKVMNEYITKITNNFSDLYNKSDFSFSEPVNVSLITLAVNPEVKYDFMDKIKAAETIQDTTPEVVHVSILESSISEFDMDFSNKYDVSNK